MPNQFDATESSNIDRDNRVMAVSGIPMSGVLNDLYAKIDTGNIGVTADAGDVDSLALGGGSFTRDKSTSDGASLNFSWKASRFHNGLSNVTVIAGTLTLSASATNYVEVDRSGAVSSNTSGFTAGRLPLWIIAADSASYTDANVVSAKPLLTLIGLAGVVGSMLSTPAATKELHLLLGTISATTTVNILTPNVAATLASLALAVTTTVTTSDTDYWAITAVNLGPSGAGSTNILGTATTNTTKATGGSALTAGIARNLALSATGANLVTAAQDVLQITLTKNGSAADLVNTSLRADLLFAA